MSLWLKGGKIASKKERFGVFRAPSKMGGKPRLTVFFFF